MGDARFDGHYARVRDAPDPVAAMMRLRDEDVIAALAAAARTGDAYLANVLATEALNRVRRLGATTRSLGDGVCAVDRKGSVTYMNTAAERLLGWSLEEVRGRDAVTLMKPRSPDGVMLPREAFDVPPVADAPEREARGEVVVEARDGRRVPIAYSVSPVVAEGEATGAVFVIRDVTAWKRTRENLRASEEAFRVMAEYAPDIIARFDRDARHVYVNPAVEKITGLPAAHFIGKTHKETGVPEPLATEFRETVLNVFRTGEEEVLDYAFEGPTGTRHLQARLAPELGEDGAPVSVLAIARDVTDRVRVEQKLKERLALERTIGRISERFLGHVDFDAAVTASLADIGAIADADRVYVFLLRGDALDNTHEWCRDGVDPQRDELQGVPCSMVPWWMKELSSGRHIHVGNLEDLPAAASGERAILEPQGIKSILAFPLTAGEDLVGFIGVDDVRTSTRWPTEDVELLAVAARIIGNALARKRAEDAERRLNAELERRVMARTRALEAANRDLEAFADSVSHDLRTPVRALDYLAQAILEDHGDALPDAVREDLGHVRAASERMAAVVEGLLDVSRVTRGELRRELVDLSGLARDIAREFMEATPQRRVTFEAEDGVRVRGDARLLRLVLENLIGNAWKFTTHRKDAHVAFGVDRNASGNGAIACFVADNGVGFDPALADAAFTPFRRLHAPNDYPGTGVGLASVQRIVHKHGGDVWADAVPGEGATFWFKLPR